MGEQTERGRYNVSIADVASRESGAARRRAQKAVVRTLFCTVAALLISSGAAPAGYVAAGLVDDHGSYYPPAMAKPPVGGSYLDPVFGTRVTRLTDDAATFRTGTINPEYAQISAFNRDDSYLILRSANGSTLLHHGDGEFSRYLSSPNGILYEPRWSRLEQDWLYYHTGTGRRIYRYDVGANTHTLIADYGVAGAGKSRVCSSSIYFGGGQSDISDNERINITCDGRYLMVVDLQTGRDFGVGDAQGNFDAVTLAMDGESMAVAYNQEGSSRFTGFEQYSKEGDFLVQLMHSGGHLAMARETDGTPVMVVNNANSYPQQPPCPDCDWNGIVKISLDGQATRTLLVGLIDVASNCCAAELFAGRSGDGWVYVGTYRGFQPSPSEWLGYDQEIFRIRLDGAHGHGEARVERLVHHRSTTVQYSATPLLSVSMTGQRLVFPSDFGSSNGNIDTYMLDLEGGGEPPPPPPSPGVNPPTSLQTMGLPDPLVQLTWQDNSDNEESFEVLRQAPGEASPRSLALVGAGVTAYQDFAVVSGGQYCYHVVAHGAGSSSAPSNTSCATPPAGPQPPTSPSNLQTVGTAEPVVDMSWQEGSGNEDSFEVRRRSPGDATFWPIGVVNANVTTYQDRGVSAGEEFCYHVIAKSQYGDSPPSNTSCATPPAAAPSVPVAPTALQADWLGGRRVHLSWNDNSDDETVFEIHRREGSGSFRRVGRVPADVTTLEDNRVRFGRSYCYRVFARNRVGQSVSNEACVQLQR